MAAAGGWGPRLRSLQPTGSVEEPRQAQGARGVPGAPEPGRPTIWGLRDESADGRVQGRERQDGDGREGAAERG